MVLSARLCANQPITYSTFALGKTPFHPHMNFLIMVPIPKTSSGKSITFKLQAIAIAANQIRRNHVDISNLKPVWSSHGLSYGSEIIPF